MKKVFVFLLLAVMLLSLCACAGRTATIDDLATLGAKSGEVSDWQTQYDLGVRYLSEGRYEDAILAFNAAIEIDPKNPDAYIKLAEAYEQTGDDETALRTLQAGVETSHDSSLGLLAERKQKELDKANEPAVTPAIEPEEPTEPEGPETPAEPDWPAQLAGIRYFGDVSNCHMSREAAEAYAAVLEQMPEIESVEGVNYTLRTALLDPGDGYPLLLTCYLLEGMSNAGSVFMNNEDGSGPCQIWCFKGKSAERYFLLNDAGSGESLHAIVFGTYDNQPGLRVWGTVWSGSDYLHRELDYTVSEYRLTLQHSFLYEQMWDYDDEASAHMQEYLDAGWVASENDGGDYVYFYRCLADGAKSRSNGADGASLNDDLLQAGRVFRADDALAWDIGKGPGNAGYLDLWSDAAAMCAALRGQ